MLIRWSGEKYRVCVEFERDVPLVKIDIGLLADQVGVSTTDTLDLGHGVHDLLLSIDLLNCPLVSVLPIIPYIPLPGDQDFIACPRAENRHGGGGGGGDMYARWC